MQYYSFFSFSFKDSTIFRSRNLLNPSSIREKMFDSLLHLDIINNIINDKREEFCTFIESILGFEGKFTALMIDDDDNNNNNNSFTSGIEESREKGFDWKKSV